MTKEDMEDCLRRVEGQNAAIGMALHLFIETHPDQLGFAGALLERSERLQARLLASHVPDAVREGAEAFVHHWLVKKPAE